MTLKVYAQVIGLVTITVSLIALALIFINITNLARIEPSQTVEQEILVAEKSSDNCTTIHEEGTFLLKWGLSRCIDEEAGVVCWVVKKAIDCMPLSDTQLYSAEQ